MKAGRAGNRDRKGPTRGAAAGGAGPTAGEVRGEEDKGLRDAPWTPDLNGPELVEARAGRGASKALPWTWMHSRWASWLQLVGMSTESELRRSY